MRPSAQNRCNPPDAAAESRPVFVRVHRAMATGFTVHIEGDEEDRALACFESVREEIDRVEQTFSRFRASAEIARINREAATAPVVTDPEVFNMLAAALEMSRRTDGVFDATIGPLTRAWGFSSRSPKFPTETELQAARALVGWRQVELDPEVRSVHFSQPGVELDLGAMAKGYAVDCALDVMAASEVEGLVDAGSSSMAATAGASAALRSIAIAHPLDGARVLGEVRLQGRALATSGVRQQSFVHDGLRFSHLLDPTRNEIAAHRVLQTTLLAPSATVADALSTALFLLGPERGRRALERFDDCSALWILEDSNSLRGEFCNWPEDSRISLL
jgi:thiamine biosynthesis lipoprotein